MLPLSAFRTREGTFVLVPAETGIPIYGGGEFIGGPAMTVSADGMVYLAGLDVTGAAWCAAFAAQTRTWDFSNGGGQFQGEPSIAAGSDVHGRFVVVAARDPMSGCWLGVLCLSTRAWTWHSLGGHFASDPVVACDRGDRIVIAGRDAGGALWTSRFQLSQLDSDVDRPGFRNCGGTLVHRPSLAIEDDGIATIAARDESGGVWVGRMENTTWLDWKSPGGKTISDPAMARAEGGGAAIAGITPEGAVYLYVTERAETFGLSVGWSPIGGLLTQCAVATYAGSFWVTGEDRDGVQWWHDTQSGRWRDIGLRQKAAGQIAAGPT